MKINPIWMVPVLLSLETLIVLDSDHRVCIRAGLNWFSLNLIFGHGYNRDASRGGQSWWCLLHCLSEWPTQSAWIFISARDIAFSSVQNNVLTHNGRQNTFLFDRDVNRALINHIYPLIRPYTPIMYILHPLIKIPANNRLSVSSQPILDVTGELFVAGIKSSILPSPLALVVIDSGIW